jgi:hypothetical protein
LNLASVRIGKLIPGDEMIASVLSIAELKGESKQSTLAVAHLLD